MEERERSGKLSPEIYVYATNKNFLNIYDALRIEKIKIEVTGYDPASKRQTGHASAWLDCADARLLTHLVAHRLFAAVTGGKWEKFGGSQRDDGSIESRTILVEWDEGDGGRFSRNPYRLTISNGPGRKTELGAVTPAGEPTARLSMRMTEPDMMKVMLAVSAYMEAYEAAHHHRIVAERMRELSAKLAERNGERGATGNRVMEPQDGYEAERSRLAPVAPPRTAQARTADVRPLLKAIPGGNADLNRVDKSRNTRVG